MSRITIIILTLAALGMAIPSVSHHLLMNPESLSFLEGGEGHRATGLAPLIISLKATPPSNSFLSKF